MDLTVDQLICDLREQGVFLPDGNVRIGGFGDSEALSNSLISLMVAGTKRGTCSLLWSWDHDGHPIPQAGDIEIVLDWHNHPVLVRRSKAVAIVPFEHVTADFAASEGEGDLSLSYWRSEHWCFFTSECLRIGRSVEQSMPLVCETFEVLYLLDRSDSSLGN
jgi:uncharacterized protein YhfF